jgi:glutathione S-transferase
VKLYSREISPYAARVRVSIFAKQLPIQVVDDPDVSTAEFARHNSLRRVPVLICDNDSALPESDTIVEYLEDAFPERSLRPIDPMHRARVRLIARVVELYVFPAAVPIFAARATGDVQRLNELFDALDATLTQLTSFLDPSNATWHAWGDRLTTADGALAPFLFYVNFLSKACGREPFEKHDRLQTFWAGAKSEPVLATVIDEIGRAMMSRQGGKK